MENFNTKSGLTRRGVLKGLFGVAVVATGTEAVAEDKKVQEKVEVTDAAKAVIDQMKELTRKDAEHLLVNEQVLEKADMFYFVDDTMVATVGSPTALLEALTAAGFTEANHVALISPDGTALMIQHFEVFDHSRECTFTLIGDDNPATGVSLDQSVCNATLLSFPPQPGM